MAIKTVGVWPTNENGELLTQLGAGTGNVSGYVSQDNIPTDDTTNKVPIVFPEVVSKRIKTQPVVAALGDSITQFNTTTSSTLVQKNSIGFMVWAAYLSNQAFSFEPSGNFGKSGDTTTQILARLDACFNYGADIYNVLGGTNDIEQDVSYNVIINNLKTMYDKLLSAGSVVVAFAITPRSFNMNPARYQKLARVNNWIRNYVLSKRNMLFVDVGPRWWNQATAGTLITGVTSDFLHPAPTGASYMAMSWLDVVKPFLPVFPRRYVDANDIYDIVNNPYGNMLTNGVLSGSVTTAVAGTSGTVPTGWSASRISGSSTAAFSAQSRTDGQPGFELQVTLNATGATASESFRVQQVINLSGTSYQPGDIIYAECEVDMGASTGLLECALRPVENDGTLGITYQDMATQGQPMPSAASSGILRSPLIVVRPYSGTGTAQLSWRFQITVDGTTSGTGVFKIRNPVFKKVN